MKTGTVYLVGAGPSDVGLLTERGRQLIESADVIVYDRLIGTSLLLQLPDSAELIDVGKRAGNHTLPQADINRLLLTKAQEGKTVVRLKGGDPFLFGRGGEELELLAQHGIPFEVVPGVPSAISVPAYNGIPVTHRDAVSSLHIITGHKRAGQPLNLDFNALVNTGGTLVFLMGVSALRDICAGLLDAGIHPEMPAAILQQGTTAGQKRVSATVSTLPEEVERQGIATPAIIVVGEVCRYADEFAWAERRPLFGARIVVTRPKARIGTLSGLLREQGAEVWEIPAIRTEPILPNDALRRELSRLETYRYLVFTSPAGVEVFCEAMLDAGMDIRRLGAGKIAAIGAGTARELRKHGILADLVPDIYDAAHLGRTVAADCKGGERILIVRAKEGSPALIEELSNVKDVELVDIPLYETVYETPARVDLEQAMDAGELDMAVFTSASTVRGFARAAAGADLTGLTAVCIGTQTEKAAQQLGMPTVTAETATVDSLVQAAVRAFSDRR